MAGAEPLYAVRDAMRGVSSTMSSQADFLSRAGQAGWAGGNSTAAFLRDLGAGMSHAERLAQVRWLARTLDDSFGIPGTRIRFGWDSVLGLFPGFGDVLTSALSLVIVHHAWQTGASKFTLARMLGNVAADFAIGAIPFLGDLFDFAFKANRRNARLLEQHLHKPSFTPPAALTLRYLAAASASASSSVKTRLRVRKRTPSGASTEKPCPRPGTTSMMSWVCFQ